MDEAVDEYQYSEDEVPGGQATASISQLEHGCHRTQGRGSQGDQAGREAHIDDDV